MPLENLLRTTILMTFKGFKHGHVHIGNARIQRGEGVRNPWKTTSSIGFYGKKQLRPITLEKVGLPEIIYLPPAWNLGKL